MNIVNYGLNFLFGSAKKIIRNTFLLNKYYLLRGLLKKIKILFINIKKRGGLLKVLIKGFFLIFRAIKQGFNLLVTDPYDYKLWIDTYEKLSDKDIDLLKTRIGIFSKKPLISILMPTYNSNPIWLIDAIESVKAQIYSNWELCIADDASSNSEIKSIIKEYARQDSRIKYVFRDVNGHISRASNSALDLATGDWIALLDHDDTLALHALFWVVDAINRHPDVRMIYSDEDKIDVGGERSDPYFKCDWNEDLFYSHNMFSHLGVFQASLLKEVGGFRIGFEGSQDYDLVLRCIEKVKPSMIYHIPRVLYHWRMHNASIASSISDAKPYAMIAGEKALNEHIKRKNVSAHAELIGSGYRVRYDLPKFLPLVSLIIPTRNQFNLIKNCIESILNKTNYTNYQIIIVDNGSDDKKTLDYFETLKRDSRIRVIKDDRPFNYSQLNNSAVKYANGEYLALINNDIEVINEEWLNEMISLAIQPGVGAVGARLWYANDTLQHGGIIVGLGGVAGHSHKYLPRNIGGYFNRAQLIQSFSAVTAACLVVNKRLYEEVGGLDEINLTVAFNDVDFCLSLVQKGYRNVWTPYAELYHHESASRGLDDNPHKIMRLNSEINFMKSKWGESLCIDPAYSPNLTLYREDFSLAWPPRVTN